MDKLVKYKINKDITFCPISLNNTILRNQPSRGGSDIKMEEERLLKILSAVESDSSTMYILDFSGISKLSLKRENIPKLFEVRNSVSYLGKSLFSNYLIEKKDSLCIIDDENGCLTYNCNIEKILLEFIQDKLSFETDIIKVIHTYAYIYFFLQDAENNNHKYDRSHLKYLESSNVYVNRYINIKSFFLKPTYMYLLINDLIEMLKKRIPNYDKVCLLGVSNNGIILSRLIAYQLQLEVKSINHIGPKYCLDSDSEVLKDLKNKKFILISDVVCLGGEYRIAKGILEALGAKLLGAICVVKIRDIYRNRGKDVTILSKEKDIIYSLVDNVNQYEIDGRNMSYKIYIDREEQ